MKSQLAAMSGTTPATKVAQSQVARFVQSYIKGGEAAHDFAMSIISTAVLEAYKGNTRNIAEAASFAVGKTKKARAMQAGFAALVELNVPTLSRAQLAELGVSYAGKLDDAANKDIKERIHGLAVHAAAEFEIAFLSVMHAVAEPKATKEAAAPAASADDSTGTEADDTAPADATPATVEVGLTEAVEAVVLAVQQGMLEQDEYALLRAALAAYDARNDAAAVVVGTDNGLSAALAGSPAEMAQAA
jgi:hypothetical protein